MARKKLMPEYPKCPFKNGDCFALLPGHLCYCLEDTNFKPGRECPFYKTEDEYLQDHINELEECDDV